jgi:hypothetical protein
MIRRARRGMQDLRSRAGVAAASESSAPHAVYLKMAMLEIERERRAKEHVASATRTARLEQRMKQIDEEVRQLAERTQIAVETGASDAPNGSHAPDAETAWPRVFRF